MTRVKFDTSLIPNYPDLSYETSLWQSGLTYVAGIDEAGRGALAGPVAVGAVVLPHDVRDLHQILAGVRDSKQMRPLERAQWAVVIKHTAAAWAVAYSSAQEIDALGIAAGVRLAAKRAVESLSLAPQHLLVDYIRLPQIKLPQTPLVKGDARVLSIACASVLAKTERDALMCAYEDNGFAGYGFAQHKGYGTRQHFAALKALGACDQHRKSFRPIKS